MSDKTTPLPVVMAMSGCDPTGGAGIQADIEAISSHGCHVAPVVTAITVQDTQDMMGVAAVDPPLIVAQARTVLEDLPIAVIKIGLLASVEIVESIHSVLSDYPGTTVVLDPILASGNGAPLVDNEVQEAMETLLFPHTTVLTPNSLEARTLAPEADNLDACGMALLDRGCEFVLISGTHENTPEVTNVLYGNRRRLESFTWERLSGSFHGSGCTLASSIAGLLAQGLEPFNAIHEAQEYTWETLNHGYRLGMGQLLPNRLFWARAEDE